MGGKSFKKLCGGQYQLLQVGQMCKTRGSPLDLLINDRHPSKKICGRKSDKMAPQSCPHPNLLNLWKFTLRGKRNFADVIKFKNLKWRVILVCLKYNHMSLQIKEGGRRVREVNKVWSNTIAGHGAMRKESKWPLETEKSGKPILPPLKPPGNQPS